MAVQLFTNNAVTLLDANINNSVLSLAVTAGEGALFPNPTAGDWFYVTLQAGSIIEIVKVTTRTGDTFTIVRAQDGTSAVAWTAGDTIELRLSKAWLDTVHTEDSIPAASIGDASGPAVAVDGNVALFDGTTGKVIKDSGLALSGTNTGDQVLSDATITTTDITTNDFTTAKHGFVPKGTNVGSFLKDDGSWDIPGVSLPDPIVNGGMNLWQRATTFTGLTTLDYLSDQFAIEFLTSVGVMDAVQASPSVSAIHTPTGQRLNHALRIDVTTIDATIAAAEFVDIFQKIEGYRAIPFIHNEFTVSFYIRSNLTGQFALAVGNDGDDRNYIKTWSPTTPDVWERMTITVPAQDLTGTWNYKTDVGLNLRWVLAAGTDHDGTDAVWNSTADFAVAGTENFLSNTANYIELTGVQLDLGPQAKPYRGVPYETDLIAAQRYYQKSYDIAIDPGTVSTPGQSAFVANGTSHFEPINFPVRMRSTPTVVLYSPATGATANVRDTTGGADKASTVTSAGEAGAAISMTTSIDGNVTARHYTAEATL